MYGRRNQLNRGSVVEQVFREERARVLASLARALRDFELAEDALQDAFAAALERWPQTGTPDSPAAWLLAVARNRAIDKLRRRRTSQAKPEELGAGSGSEQETMFDPDHDRLAEVGDERLSMLFTCCHPALSVDD